MQETIRQGWERWTERTTASERETEQKQGAIKRFIGRIRCKAGRHKVSAVYDLAKQRPQCVRLHCEQFPVNFLCQIGLHKKESFYLEPNRLQRKCVRRYCNERSWPSY